MQTESNSNHHERKDPPYFLAVWPLPSGEFLPERLAHSFEELYGQSLRSEPDAENSWRLYCSDRRTSCRLQVCLGSAEFLPQSVLSWLLVKPIFTEDALRSEIALFACRIADACQKATAAGVYESAEGRTYSAEEWKRKDLRTFDITNHITVYGMEDFETDVAWVHTSGMLKFGLPDLENYCSPARTWRDAGVALSSIARYLVSEQKTPRIGETIRFQGREQILQFCEPQAHEYRQADEWPVLQVRTVTVGQKAVDRFRSITGLAESAQKAVAFHLHNRTEKAIKEYHKALRGNPDDVYTLNNLGYLLITQGGFNEAIALLNRAVRLDGSYALAHNNLGSALLQQGDIQSATASYQQAVAADSSYAMPHRNLALVHHLQGRTEEAINEMRAYFKLAPADVDDPDAHYNFGVMLSERARADEALAEYERAIAQRPNFAKALNNIGLFHFAAGRKDQAIEFYRHALDADPAFTLARFNLATALASQGDIAGAIEEYQRVLEKEPEHVQAASNLGVLYTSQGKADEAVPIFEKLVSLHARSPIFRFNLALAHQMQHSKKKAAQQFAEVLKLEPAGSARAIRTKRELEALRQT